MSMPKKIEKVSISRGIGAPPSQQHRSRSNSSSKQGLIITPLGALLRVTHEALTQTILKCLSAQGIKITETEFSVMRFPGPDGVRPIDLARRCNMTKQAMNYVLSGLEAAGYIRRKSAPGQRARTIFLTPKGWELIAAIRKCATDTERVWAEHIGTRRLETARSSLHEIATWLGKLEVSTNTSIGEWGVGKI